MRLLFKQRFFSWLDSYDIYYESGEIAYTVKGKLGWGHRFAIYDSNGREIAFVQEKIFRLLPEFQIYKNGSIAGRLKKEFHFFTPKYNIDFNNWKIEGDMFEWDYSIKNVNGMQIANISKELWHFTDHYIIDVINPKDSLDALLVVLAIDAEKCSRDS